MTTKDEIKNRISMTLKDPILQQGFEIICKNLAELEKACDETQELLDKQIEATFKLVKENAELKERADKADLDSVLFFNKLCKAKEIIETLSKSLFLAKGIIRDLIDDTVDFKESKERAKYCYEQESFDVYKEAEQFLKEVEDDSKRVERCN